MTGGKPAIVVLGDCDLVADHRGGTTNAALFDTLEAIGGLDDNADVTFILTTNRIDPLERALAEVRGPGELGGVVQQLQGLTRPGRVVLAVAVEKPDLDGRRWLFALYGADVGHR